MRRLLFCSLIMLGISANSWADKVLTEFDHQQIVPLKPKERLIVKLPTNPSSGYLWFLESSDPRSETLQLSQDWRFVPRKKSQLPPIGDSTWGFTAKHGGEVTLRFIYRKPWQGPEVEPLDIREYRLVVTEQS